MAICDGGELYMPVLRSKKLSIHICEFDVEARLQI
jgi:hypothetical protein